MCPVSPGGFKTIRSPTFPIYFSSLLDTPGHIREAAAGQSPPPGDQNLAPALTPIVRGLIGTI
jgi:hypothetical protein